MVLLIYMMAQNLVGACKGVKDAKLVTLRANSK